MQAKEACIVLSCSESHREHPAGGEQATQQQQQVGSCHSRCCCGDRHGHGTLSPSPVLDLDSSVYLALMFAGSFWTGT